MCVYCCGTIRTPHPKSQHLTKHTKTPTLYISINKHKMKDDIIVLIADYLGISTYSTYQAIMGKRFDRQAILAKRLFIAMLRYKGMDYKKIAKAINCSYATTYKQVSNHHLNNIIKEYEKSRTNSTRRNDTIQQDNDK